MKKKRDRRILWALRKLDRESSIRNFTFRDKLASAIIEGDNNTYSTLIDFNNYHFECSCPGFLSHKTACKHVILLTIYCYLNLLITDNDIKELGLEVIFNG